jgi:hypothetical protein
MLTHLPAAQAMFSASAHFYDLVYGKKDYRAETDRLRELFRQFVPQGLLLLDRDQWQDFFREAGLSAEYLPEAFTSRGLYVARSSEPLKGEVPLNMLL